MTNRLINLVKKVNELNYLSDEYKLPKKGFLEIINNYEKNNQNKQRRYKNLYSLIKKKQNEDKE